MNKQNEIPDKILNKLRKNENEAHSIIEEANKLIKDIDCSSISLKYKQSAPLDVLTPLERAVSMVFMFRYDHLPEYNDFVVGEHRGKYYINEIDDIRAALNEYRTIFYNKKDSLYYGKISNIYREKLLNRDARKGLSISAIDNKENDITLEYIAYLDSTKKAIRYIIDASDFNYIFNGVLQHSDIKYSNKLINDYTDGNLNYILLKNLTLAKCIKLLFKEYARIIGGLSFPRMGSL
jgi:hypothetical protein